MDSNAFARGMEEWKGGEALAAPRRSEGDGPGDALGVARRACMEEPGQTLTLDRRVVASLVRHIDALSAAYNAQLRLRTSDLDVSQKILARAKKAESRPADSWRLAMREDLPRACRPGVTPASRALRACLSSSVTPSMLAVLAAVPDEVIACMERNEYVPDTFFDAVVETMRQIAYAGETP